MGKNIFFHTVLLHYEIRINLIENVIMLFYQNNKYNNKYIDNKKDHLNYWFQLFISEVINKHFINSNN